MLQHALADDCHCLAFPGSTQQDTLSITTTRPITRFRRYLDLGRGVSIPKSWYHEECWLHADDGFMQMLASCR